MEAEAAQLLAEAIPHVLRLNSLDLSSMFFTLPRGKQAAWLPVSRQSCAIYIASRHCFCGLRAGRASLCHHTNTGAPNDLAESERYTHWWLSVFEKFSALQRHAGLWCWVYAVFHI